jgi:hypothetical protein
VLDLFLLNEEGDARIKIGLEGSSDYTNLSDIFDDVEVKGDHTAEVLKALKQVMLTREQSKAQEEQEEEEDEDAEAAAKAAEVKAARDAKKAKTAK